MKPARLACAIWLFAACEGHVEPPGGRSIAESVTTRVSVGDEPASDLGDVVSTAIRNPGSVDDNLPFEPRGEKVGSIAWRTWVYTDIGSQRTRYGYLRAGAIVDSRGPKLVNEGCAGGWLRINPRGFVCLGKGATTDLDHPTLVASGSRPRRGEGLPYEYALSRENAPHLYHRLPTSQEMERTEGGYRARAATWLGAVRQRKRDAWIADTPPDFLSQRQSLVRPYGVDRGLHIGAHAGQASRESGFALASGFMWEGRAMALTTELDVIGLDRTKLVAESEFSGVELGPTEDLPAAIVKIPWASRYRKGEDGRFRSVDAVAKRTVLKLTGETLRDGAARYHQTVDDTWIAEVGLLVLPRRESFPSVATGTRKWIDIGLRGQTLVAYRGRKAEYVTLVSSGSGGLGDPEEVPATVQGTFMIHSKHTTATMDGEEDVSDSFELRDVPFVQYFHKGYALHAAYWHDDFGRYRSHGCINLAPLDAAWLFEWTDPFVPSEWHAVINKDRGTVVHIHP